jgi:hypothetical protein
MPVGTWFNSFLFTPTGLPIEHEAPLEWEELGSTTFENLACVSPRALEATIHQVFTVPWDLREGIYVPQLIVPTDVPGAADEPTLITWFHDGEVAALPPLRVGDPATPHIPWTLLGDYPANGHRGLQAREDRGVYALPTRVRFPPHLVVIPRSDPRTGEPLRYRLEPGSYWVSGTERRTPCPPKIPLVLPGGELAVEVVKPGGRVDLLGPAPILRGPHRSCRRRYGLRRSRIGAIWMRAPATLGTYST